MRNKHKWHSILLVGLVLLLASSVVACGKCYTQEDLDAAREEGYAQGYDIGYAAGKTVGYAEGYNDGLAKGEAKKEEAKTQAYNKGYWTGYAEAQGEGYDRGYADGHQKGYSEGYSKGCQVCRSPPPPPPSTSGNYVGSINSDVYHYLSCRYVKQIYPENKIWFSSTSDARAHGYRPCKVCCPP